MHLNLRPYSGTALAAAILTAAAGCVYGQATPVQEFDSAYKAAASKDYDAAIALFRKGLLLQPGNASAHKDLAYTLLKTGETAEARDEFEAALRLNPADETAALEFAFLAYETQKPIEARETFNKLRQSATPQTRSSAEQAFQNIDKPLAAGIARWKAALQNTPNPDTLALYSGHWELGQLAELRGEANLAAEQFEICRRLKPDLSELLLVLARVWQTNDRAEDAHAALLLASRSRDSRTAEMALERMGARYPYPYEFANALKLDERNTLLRKELGYLYLAMGKTEEAKAEFKRVLDIDGKDQAAIDQLSELNGFHRRAPAPSALPTATATRATVPERVDPRAMGLKSLALGYSRDAIKFLRQAHENNPEDAEIMMKLGYAYNLAKDDADAIPWFDRARRSSDELIATEANRAFHNLRGDVGGQTTIWMQPMFSTRRSDLSTNGQVKRTLPLPGTFLNHNFSLYLSNRFDGDLQGTTRTAYGPSYLSESAFIFAAGLSTKSWHHLMAWAEAGEAIKYLPGRRDQMTPDVRGGVDYTRFFGHSLASNSSGLFLETGGGAHYVNRWDKDWMFSSQTGAGYTFRTFGGTQAQVLWDGFYTRDAKREYWANTAEFGPGVKLHAPWMPAHLNFTTDFLRGVYLRGPYVDADFHRHFNYNDIRVGFWYAFTK